MAAQDPMAGSGHHGVLGHLALLSLPLLKGRLPLPREPLRLGDLRISANIPQGLNCYYRGALCEGRSLAELESTPSLAGHCAPGHRATPAQGDGLPAPAQAS